MPKIDKKKDTEEKKLVEKLVGVSSWTDSDDLKKLDIDSLGKRDLKKAVIKIWEDGGNADKIKTNYYNNLETIKEESDKRKTMSKELISSKEKILYKNDERTGKKRISWGRSILLFILFIILCFSVISALNPTTALSIETNQAEIDENTTYYIIKGTTDVGANVNISSNELNLNNINLNLSSDGSFQYKLFIPKNIKNAEVKIIAKVENKSESEVSLTINRKEPTKEEPKTTEKNSTSNSMTPEEKFISEHDKNGDNLLDSNEFPSSKFSEINSKEQFGAYPSIQYLIEDYDIDQNHKLSADELANIDNLKL